MKDYNTNNNNSNNENEGRNKKTTGFNKFGYLNLEKGGYPMSITTYETRIRKKILKLKEERKKTTDTDEREVIEKDIAKLKGSLINNTDNAIFNYLTANIQANNKVNLNKIRKTQGGIAEELCLERTTVSKAFAKLKRLHIIKYKTEGNAFDYIEISPYIIWQGEASSHKQKIAIMNESFVKRPFETGTFY